MSDETSRVEAAWRRLRNEGQQTGCRIQAPEVANMKPVWLDEARFAAARQVVQKYFLGVQFSSFTGLLLILQLPNGLEPLLSTGTHKDIPSLFKRYLATVLYVESWYDGDVFEPDSKAYKAIRVVQSMHRRVQANMNDKFRTTDMEESAERAAARVWFNHYDVALTQFAFIGLAMLYPHKTGMIAATKYELEQINYFWRVIGSLMGVGDEFNACQFDKYDDIREFNRLIFEREYLDKFAESPCEKGLSMTQSICLAMSYFMPLMTFNSLAHWWKDFFHFNGYEPQPLSVKERLIGLVTSVSFNHALKHEILLRLTTKMHRKRFDQRVKTKDKEYERLVAKYKDCPHLTYYSDRVDYQLGGEREQSAPPKAGACPLGFGGSAPEAS